MLVKKNKKENKLQENQHLDIFAERIVTIRMELEMTIATFATNAGIEQAQQLYFENSGGGKTTTILKIISFVKSLGYNLDWLLLMDNSHSLKKASNINDIQFDLENLKINVENQIKETTDFIKKTNEKLRVISKISKNI